MRRGLPAVLLGLMALLGPVGRAGAGTLRLAIVAGNNTGADDQPRLHYAEEDAAKVARVLGDLGGVAWGDLALLQGRSRAELQEAFARVTQRIAERHQHPGERALLIFYFSGHSDGEALELGEERLTFSELRRALLASGADIRVAIVDSCRSGALLTAKGGRAGGPAFDIRLRDDLPATGQVLLTSSAADEQALESREIHGSYFTHHLVSGLRGAADASGRGQVTLGEAYRYAYEHTVAATSQVFVGPQHPAYDFRLSGMGELVLTELPRPASALVLPAGFLRALVVESGQGGVLAEVPAGAARRLVVPAGSYQVRLWRGEQQLEGQVTVEPGQAREVGWGELGAVATLAPGLAKGPGLAGAAPTPRAHVLSLSLAGVGLVAAGAAVYGGVEVLSYQGLVARAAQSPGAYSSGQATDARARAAFWRVGWPVAAAAAAGLGVGAAFTW